MKKKIQLIIALSLFVLIGACSSDPPEEVVNPEEEGTTPEEEVVIIDGELSRWVQNYYEIEESGMDPEFSFSSEFTIEAGRITQIATKDFRDNEWLKEFTYLDNGSLSKIEFFLFGEFSSGRRLVYNETGDIAEILSYTTPYEEAPEQATVYYCSCNQTYTGFYVSTLPDPNQCGIYYNFDDQNNLIKSFRGCDSMSGNNLETDALGNITRLERYERLQTFFEEVYEYSDHINPVREVMLNTYGGKRYFWVLNSEIFDQQLISPNLISGIRDLLRESADDSVELLTEYSDNDVILSNRLEIRLGSEYSEPIKIYENFYYYD